MTRLSFYAVVAGVIGTMMITKGRALKIFANKVGVWATVVGFLLLLTHSADTSSNDSKTSMPPATTATTTPTYITVRPVAGKYYAPVGYTFSGMYTTEGIPVYIKN